MFIWMMYEYTSKNIVNFIQLIHANSKHDTTLNIKTFPTQKTSRI